MEHTYILAQSQESRPVCYARVSVRLLVCPYAHLPVCSSVPLNKRTDRRYYKSKRHQIWHEALCIPYAVSAYFKCCMPRPQPMANP